MVVEADFTVFFEDPFWVGIIERKFDNKLEVCRIVFYKEPTEKELQNFILNNYVNLKFSPSISIDSKQKQLNPKRKIRDARKQMGQVKIETKSQEAIKKQFEQSKIEKKNKHKMFRDLEKEKQYEMIKIKRKEKHRGH